MQVEDARVWLSGFVILHHMGKWIILVVIVYVYECVCVGNMQNVRVHLQKAKLAQEDGGCEGQAISQLQRQSFSSWEYIDTSETHNPVYNIHE